PNMMIIPFNSRPLFPGAYQALNVTDARVIKAAKESLRRKNPYIVITLPKDQAFEGDVPGDASEVYDVGVLAQIVNVYPSSNKKGEEWLVYSHLRVKMDEFIAPKTIVKVDESKFMDKAQIKEVAHKDGEEASTSPESKSALTNQIIQSEIAMVRSPKTIKTINIADELNTARYLQDYGVAIGRFLKLANESFTMDVAMQSLLDETFTVYKHIFEVNPHGLHQSNFSRFNYAQSKKGVDLNLRPDLMADFISGTAYSDGIVESLQKILETTNIEQRLALALDVLRIERDLVLKKAKTLPESGLPNGGAATSQAEEIDVVVELEKSASKVFMPKKVRRVFDSELAALRRERAQANTSGAESRKSYLEWLVSIPWGRYTKDEYSMAKAATVLDEDHYGMQEVKDRILEFVASAKLLGSLLGKIVCLHGPPGVGKTSITKALAKSLNRRYHRISLGGMSDASDLKGHKRTYLGAYPGKVALAMKDVKCQNPVIVLDEVDKMSNMYGSHGNPVAVLLEMLDPEQNANYVDTYLEVPIDLSRVLFVCTANDIGLLPAPVRDRMELIEVPGYTDREKFRIARDYLETKAKKQNGLDGSHISLTDEAVTKLVAEYSRESGVRGLDKYLQKIYRKVGMKALKELKLDEVSEPAVAPSPDAVPAQLENPVSNPKAKPEAKAETLMADPKPVTEAVAPGRTSREALEEDDYADTFPLAEITVDRVTFPETYTKEIQASELVGLLGPSHPDVRLFDQPPPGFTQGLAYSSMGGAVLPHEAVLEHPLFYSQSGSFSSTGLLGDVMKESSAIAYSFSKMYLSRFYPENRFFERARIHMHVLDGAIPKDGPSAGVTMVSSFLSLALNRSISSGIAMTGEMSLSGRVRPIGGLREKTMAAKRFGCTTIIFPKENIADWEKVPDYIREGFTFHAVENYSEIFNVIFPGMNATEGNGVWKADFDKIEAEAKKKKE
ncbi:hypothetical protein BABINDRAFT_19874, partial [Babjeviella inositovora NRRL Y-12698]